MHAELEKRLARGGLESSGRRWVLKALNPVAEIDTEGIPDQSSTPVLRPEYRVETSIESPPGAAALWDCYIFSLPGDVNTLYWASAPATGGPVDFTAVTPPAGYAVGRIQLQDVTESANAIYFRDLSTPTWPPFSSYFATSYPTSRPLGFRHVYKSLTIHLIAPAVANQGTVYAAQFPPKFGEPATVVTCGESSRIVAGGPARGAIGRVLRIPGTEADLTLMTPDPFVGPARDGIYMPLHMTGPAQPYTETLNPTMYIAGGGGAYGPLNDGGVAGSLNDSWSNAAILVEGGYRSWPSYAVRPRLDAGIVDPLVPTGWDSGFDNTNVGVIIFRGLAAAAAGSFGASLQVKAMVGLEIIPRPSAPNRVFSRPAAVYDPLAMRLYYEVLRELRQAYPASYNAFGLLGPLLTSALARLAPHVPKLLSMGGELLRDVVGMRPQNPVVTAPERKSTAPIGPKPTPAAPKRKRPKKPRA